MLKTPEETPLQTPVRGLRAIFEHAATGIALLDSRFRIVHCNAAMSDFLGDGFEPAARRNILELVHDDDGGVVRARLAELESGRERSLALEGRFKRACGGLRWGALSISAVSEAEYAYVGFLQDVTERKTLEQQLLHQAFHDALTGLPNRALFRERVTQALARAARTPGRLAVVFLDLDSFKEVNDTRGHGAGDRLLQVVARRLLNATRGGDTVARFGGDEFAVLLEDLDGRSGAEAVLDRIVTSLRKAVDLDGKADARVSASMGVAFHEPGQEAEEVLRNADLAMYEAKSKNRGRWVVYDESMHVALVERVTLEVDLREALERRQLSDSPRLADTGRFPSFDSVAVAHRCRSEFSVAYQPIVELATGRLMSFEALARWTHPERGPVSPGIFIPLLERSGGVSALGRQVLREACAAAASWPPPGDVVGIGVNLSACQIQNDSIVAAVDSVLDESGLAPQRLTLEITESVIMMDAGSTLDRLRRLKSLGVRLAIDDFGTGYSSLSYLQKFPIDVVKIDRLFTEAMRSGDEVLIRAILALARALSLQTVAEGVENTAQSARLLELGCDAGQGFLFGRPADAEQATALAAGWSYAQSQPIPRGRAAGR